MRIGIVAGEASGDILGAGLIPALKKHASEELQFEGIGGPLMEAEGFSSQYPMERLSVMGLVEVLGRLRELLGIRKKLRQQWLANPPDIFIGIDAPDFNLPLERSLRQAWIPTVHYVSPSIWAWRRKRVFKIARSTDLMLCLLPFEVPFYQQAGVDARFVGHTLADQLPLVPDVSSARQALNLDTMGRYIALLPGSREGEVTRLAPLFLATARLCLQQNTELKFLIPAVNQTRYQQLEGLLRDDPNAQGLPVQLVLGQSREVMTAADAVLLASGTAALECMLLKTPMVVSYRLAPLSFYILSKLVKVPYVSLPNLLAKRMLVPELLQHQATPEALAETLLDQLNHPEQQLPYFTELHQQLRLNASEASAKAILDLLQRRKGRAMDEFVLTAYQGVLVAGVDEVGRGPLFGDVVTAAVILDPDRPIAGLADSKKLTEKRREVLFEQIKAQALSYSIARASVAEIDQLNILHATMLAMQRAVAGLAIQPEYVLIDGNRCPQLDCPSEAVVKGDARVAAIAAASILAKVTRDREMQAAEQAFPGYGLAKHKGYPTAAHLQALASLGVTDQHRQSFAPVRKLLSASRTQ